MRRILTVEAIAAFAELMATPERVEELRLNNLRHLSPTVDQYFAEVFRAVGLSYRFLGSR